MGAIQGRIKVGKNTAGHGATLRQLGYEVEDGDGGITVRGSGLVEEIDLSAGMGPLKEMIANRQLATYRTKVTFEDGKTLFGVPACTRLGQLSCLIVSIPQEKKEAAPRLTIADLGL